MPLEEALEAEFHQRMLAVYEHCSEHGYYPRRFREHVADSGGLAVAHALMAAPVSQGLVRLYAMGLPELSVEALVLESRFEPLFSPAERHAAQDHLDSVAESRLLSGHQ
ncbi:hypothetical protein GCM10011321_17530 [Youhaiella tibetensis]|uniref:Uncharacterized protein n=1 Tax=Paradevosia tibetensis TaxID=1447062 RepID=A0A5B9DME7_9HYPH|nr:hypothetical protein [Youhaiella tibetensis]QEE20162.1 hypothetical protein FNA67_08225 [Youhaiella tibetensis]GGF26586.1 hypothetical protein GCM10011321_17530 [Youhaiella tibetensis]